MFLKIIWGTGVVLQVPQNVNYLGNMRKVFPKKIGEHISLPKGLVREINPLLKRAKELEASFKNHALFSTARNEHFHCLIVVFY